MGPNPLPWIEQSETRGCTNPEGRSLPIELVLEELETYKGIQFHTKVANLLIELYITGEFPIIVEADASTEIYNSLIEHVQV